MKYTFLIVVLFSAFALNAQIYKQTKSEISFFSEAPLENIEAKNTDAKSVIRTTDSTIIVLITNLAFKFEKPLMEEHFNENYMESETYKYSTFKGKIIKGMDFSKDGTYEVEVSGILDIHGVKKERTFKGTMIKKGDVITFESNFDVHVEDHKIKVPSMYVQNIAEDVNVKVWVETKLVE